MGKPAAATDTRLVTASIADTLAMFAEVALPTLGKGIIIRRPMIVALAEALGLDSRAVKRMQRLRAKYGAGPLVFPVPGRRQAVILNPDHVHRVLTGTPEPFTPATKEKNSVLGHFEPDVSLISPLPERRNRRRFNGEVLEEGCPVHSKADAFMPVVQEEAETLLARSRGEIAWEHFATAWHKIVRRVVLGDAARDDHELTDMLAKLRAVSNWAFLHPGREDLAVQFHKRLNQHLARAEPGSLAARIAQIPKDEETSPSDQVAHYLFAFDPGGMASFRTMALLATHPDARMRAQAEIDAAGQEGRKNLPLVRACFLDSLRLWPTTPAIFRETTEDVEWDGGTVPKNTHILIFTPFFHRDDERLYYAHRFNPDLWLQNEPGNGWPLVPFSGGPGICPARDFVPMMGSAMIAALMSAREIVLKNPPLDPGKPLPGTLDNYSLTFEVKPREVP
ncbi:cytochrome P450 [Microvirga roseola]|uniref:cytochrome P450 n=1 Tax=Microvirga roseola TaxID=2883126 RepID=UPI001E4EB8A4|nr:cytochrome P450 [Microvirga roseola]